MTSNHMFSLSRMNWNAHTAIFEKFTFQTLSDDLSFDTQQGKSSKNNPQSNLGFNLLKQRLLWYHFVTLSLVSKNHHSQTTPVSSLNPPFLNISKCQSGFVSSIYTFESKSWFKFEFYLILEFNIWIGLNSNCHFFSFCCHWHCPVLSVCNQSMPRILLYA